MAQLQEFNDELENMGKVLQMKKDRVEVLEQQREVEAAL